MNNPQCIILEFPDKHSQILTEYFLKILVKIAWLIELIHIQEYIYNFILICDKR